MRIGAAAPGWTTCPRQPSALEKAIRGFVDKPGENVIVLALGTGFDTLGEAYNFYNLYSWEKGSCLIKNCMIEMQPFAEVRDGLGSEDMIAENGDVINQLLVQTAIAAASGDATIGSRLVVLLAPKKRKEMGRPTTSREKAPYEGLSKRTRFCAICRRQGQKRTTCPDRGDISKPVRKLARCKDHGIEGRGGECYSICRTHPVSCSLSVLASC